MSEIINKFVDFLIDLMAILARLVIVGIVLLIVIDVIAINFFNYSFSWILETSEYLLVFLTFLGLVWLLREDGHIKLDLLLNKLGKRNRAFLEIINSCIGLIISLTITVSGFLTTWDLYARNIKTEAILEIPRFLLIIIIPIGFTLLSVQFFRNLIDSFKEFKSKKLKDW